MKLIKKILKITGIALLVLILFAFAAPYLFKNKIIAFVKKEINNNIEAKVDFKDVDVSFFRHFPKVSVGIKDIEVTGKGQFAEDTLLAAKEIDAAVNLMSVIKGSDMTIYSISLSDPRIHAIVDENGVANYDIMKKDTAVASADEASKPFHLSLKKYAIENGYISYKDKQGGMSAEISGLNHEGSGDLSDEKFTLKTATTTDAVTFIQGAVPYLANTKISIDADLEVDNKQNSYTFKTDKVMLNDLALSTEGVIKMLASGYDMDIKFSAPSTDIKHILSLIPVIYQNDFSKIQTTGTAVFNGFVKGIYNDKQIPAFHVNAGMTNGTLKYSDLPKAVNNINLKMQADNPDGVPDNTVIDIQQAHLEFDNDPFDFRLLVKKPVSDMYVDAAAKGKLDLGKITQFIKLEEGTKLAGLLNADVSVKGSVSAIQAQQYDRFTAGGTAALSNFLYQNKDYPTGIRLHTMDAAFNPKNIQISNLNGQYLGTNFTGNAQVNNLLNYVLQNKALSGNATLNADKVNLDSFMGTTTATASNTTAAPAAAPFAVPDNIDFTLNTTVGQLHYDKLDINNLSGALLVNDETVFIKDVKGNALDGTMKINGSYSTKASKTKPDIALQYDVAGLDVQKTFNAFNTVQTLMPIGKFIAGKITSQLSLNGKLGDNMMPDMSTLTGNGNLLLIEGFLSKFAPLDKIASTLNVSQLQQISLKDVKSYFEFSNGKVFVKPFNVKVKDIEMEIGGLQGMDQSLDYVINMKLPRALMGAQGNKLVDNLTAGLNAKGVPLKVGDVVNLNLKLGGFFKSPTLKTDLKQSASSMADQLKQQATDFVKAKVDSTKQAVTNAVKDTVASVKKQLIENAKKEALNKLLGNKSDTAHAAGDTTPAKKPNIKESAKGMLDGIFKKKKP